MKMGLAEGSAADADAGDAESAVAGSVAVSTSNSSAFFADANKEILEDAITLTSFLENLGSSSEGIFMFSFSKYSLIFAGIPIL